MHPPRVPGGPAWATGHGGTTLSYDAGPSLNGPKPSLPSFTAMVHHRTARASGRRVGGAPSGTPARPARVWDDSAPYPALRSPTDDRHSTRRDLVVRPSNHRERDCLRSVV